MKKVIITLTLLFAIALTAQAQFAPAPIVFVPPNLAPPNVLQVQESAKPDSKEISESEQKQDTTLYLVDSLSIAFPDKHTGSEINTGFKSGPSSKINTSSKSAEAIALKKNDELV